MRVGVLVSTAVMVCWFPVIGAAEEIVVAGVKPDQRPENAPMITTMEKSDAWFEHAFSGVDQPYPESLNFLQNQGRWFNPFIHPGMTGPYDIRGWHKEK